MYNSLSLTKYVCGTGTQISGSDSTIHNCLGSGSTILGVKRNWNELRVEIAKIMTMRDSPISFLISKLGAGQVDKPSITNPYSRNFVQFLFHSNHCLWGLRVNICNAWFCTRFYFKCSQNNICSHNLKLRSEFEICGGNFRQMASNRA